MQIAIRLILLIALGQLGISTCLAQTVRIEGDGINNSFRDEVASYLGDLEEPKSKFTARRHAKRAAKISLDLLHSKGWLAADAEIAVEAGPPLKPLVKLSRGKLFSIEDIAIEFEDDEIASNDIPKTFLSSGIPASADTIIDEEKRLLSSLETSGYADAQTIPRTLIGDREAGSVELTYNFRSGPKVCLGKLLSNNQGRTRQSIIQKLAPFEEGEIYTPDTLAEFKKRLSQTQLYKYTKVELTPLSTPIGDEELCETRDVLVSLEDASRRTVSAGASYSEAEGFGVQAGYEMRNYSGRADTVNIDLQLNNLEQSLSGRWKQPLNGGYRHSLTLGAGIAHEETDAFDRNAFTLNALYERPWRKNIDIFGGIGAEIGEESGTSGDIDFQIISGRGGARFDNTDDALDPTHGLRILASAEPAYAIGDAEGQFLTTEINARGYTSFQSDKYVIAGRVKLGAIAGSSFADIPSSRRFYAGGGGSVRGYEFQSIGPRDVDNNPIGGRSLLEMSLEARIRLKNNFGMAAFIDAGEVGEQELPAFSDLRMGAGLGFRYYTNFGPLRLDVATPIDPRPGDQNLLIYLSIGQAF